MIFLGNFHVREGKMVKYGFIGAGNMAGAIIKGMTMGTGSYDPKKILVCSKTQTSAKKLEEQCGVKACLEAEEVISESDVVILAVKPYVLPEMLPPLREAFSEKKPLVISIAAGKPLSYLESFFEESTPIIRVMPNINAKIGESTSGFCCNECVTQTQREQVITMFSTVGKVIEIPESQFDIFSVIGGASVAFAYLYMDAMARAALKAGMSKQQALKLTAQTVLGSAKMILESEETPWELIDQVCSPGGTTIEGICSLQESGMESTIRKAFEAVLEKDRKIAGK